MAVFIDLIIPGVHKANGLHLLQQQRWGIHDSEVVVFGDGGNDIEMPRQAGFSFTCRTPAVVAAAAKYRAGSNNREGVLDIIDSVLKQRAAVQRLADASMPDNRKLIRRSRLSDRLQPSAYLKTSQHQQ